MATNSAQLCRDFMLKSILLDNTLMDVSELDDETRVYVFSQRIKKMLDADNIYLNSIATTSIASAFLDAYKLLNYKMNTMQADDTVRKQFMLLDHIYTMDDLFALIDNDNELGDSYILEDIYSYQLEFIRQNDLLKIIQYKMLSACQKDRMLDATMMYDKENDPEHCKNESSVCIDDIKECDSNSISIEDAMINYYKKREEEIQAREQMEITEDESHQIVQELFGFLKLLATYDYATFSDFIEYAAFKDYKWNKYILEHKFTGDYFDPIEMAEAMEFYELFKGNDELVEVYSNEPDYLYDLINSFIEIKCYNKYIDENVVNDEVVDDYYYEVQTRER